MKRLLLSIVFIASISFFVFADIFSDINSSMKDGNFKLIASYFNTSIELNIPGADGLFSKAQAELLMKDFFTRNTPRKFVIKHNGDSQDGSKYFIGILETGSGNFRTYYYVKNNNGNYLIKELRIERDR